MQELERVYFSTSNNKSKDDQANLFFHPKNITHMKLFSQFLEVQIFLGLRLTLSKHHRTPIQSTLLQAPIL